MNTISSTVSDMAALLGAKGGRKEMDVNAVLMLVLGIVCVFIPMELSQLTFAVGGALTYAFVQGTRKATKAKLRVKKVGVHKKIDHDHNKEDVALRSRHAVKKPEAPQRPPRRSRSAERLAKEYGKQEYRQTSAQPVAGPTFSADDFDSQVHECVKQISPTAEGDKVVQDIAAAVKKALEAFIPGAEVMGFASADVMRGTAFGVAIPEVEIILNASPGVLAERLMNRKQRPYPNAAMLDAYKLQKAAVRSCTDDLAAGGFKFRRSAFKCLEPKVTLVAVGFGDKSIPIDFMVNAVTPLYNAALLSECGQINARAKELVFLVRRWAKNRGISHAPKGHLAPYAWSLLAIYFLQVSRTHGTAILPGLKAFKQKHAQVTSSVPEQLSDSTVSVATLFKGFIDFYCNTFDWRSEAVSVRAAERKAPHDSFPINVVLLEKGTTGVGPSIENPFEPKRNLSSTMTGVSLTRLHEEIKRCSQLCSGGASLSEILEPWVPPEQESSVGGAGGAAEICDNSPEE